MFDHSIFIFQSYHQQIVQNATQLNDRLDALATAAKGEAENLGHRVNQQMSHVEPLVDACIGAASISHNNKQQTALFEQCKTVTEAQLQLLYACKYAGGNPKVNDVVLCKFGKMLFSHEICIKMSTKQLHKCAMHCAIWNKMFNQCHPNQEL
jgi:uncharacterized protein YukE